MYICSHAVLLKLLLAVSFFYDNCILFIVQAFPMSLKQVLEERRVHGKGITGMVMFAALDLFSGHSRKLEPRPSSYRIRRHTSDNIIQGQGLERPQGGRMSSNWPGVEAVQSHHLPPRTHSLTPPPSEISDQELEMYEQTQSPLFKLPPELRCQIYGEVIGNKTIHIVQRSRDKLGHTICRCNNPPCQEQCREDGCRGTKLPSGIYAIFGAGSGGILPLLKSCRKMYGLYLLLTLQDAYLLRYADAIEVLYGSNIFDFDSMESLISFSTAVLAKRFDSIQHLQLDFRFSMSVYFSESTAQNDPPRWERTWRIIGSMKALQDLWVRISWHRLDFGPVEEARLLSELDQVRQLRTFKVSLPLLKGKTVKREHEEEQFFHIVRRI